MKYKWLAFSTLALASIIVVIFFILSTRLPKVEKNETQNENILSAPTVTIIDPVRGREDAKITIVEFGDFTCEPCKTASFAIKNVLMQFPSDTRLVWKDFPNTTLHPQALNAAVAARCAGYQGKFWEYHDVLFDRQFEINETIFPKIAEDLMLNVDKFNACFENAETKPLVNKGIEEALALSLTASPTLFINDEKIVGAADFNEIVSVINAKLAEIK